MEGEEAQEVHGLLSPGRKVSETPTDVKAMEVVASRKACKESVKTVVTLLASNGMCSARGLTVTLLRRGRVLSFIFLRCSSYELNMQQSF